jgi:hypothetical protein
VTGCYTLVLNAEVRRHMRQKSIEHTGVAADEAG